MTTLARERTVCRICQGQLDLLLDLGSPTLPAYLRADEPDPERLPLELAVCRQCDLVQLRHSIVDLDRLYRRYWYQSGINEAMVVELQDVAACALDVAPCGPDDTVLDVGANDGTLLRLFSPNWRIAVEPSRTFADRLRDCADLVLPEYFPSDSTQALPDHSVTILTSNAMFYDVNDPLRFVQEVDRLLTADGVWIVQMQDLAQMVAAGAYDNICFEHQAYYSTATFRQLLALVDLEIKRVETRAINGGSLRYYVTRRHRPHLRLKPGRSLHNQLASEAWLTRARLDRFAWDTAQHKMELVSLLQACRDSGLAVDLYAASTKSSTLLQYCGIDHSLIRCAVERSPEKVGLVTSGTRIPIIDEETWRCDPAPVTLLGAWGFREGVLCREAAYTGAWIIPLPQVETINWPVQAMRHA